MRDGDARRQLAEKSARCSCVKPRRHITSSRARSHLSPRRPPGAKTPSGDRAPRRLGNPRRGRARVCLTTRDQYAKYVYTQTPASGATRISALREN
ncbi:hypothetical protein MTO96_021313 [Rhipicephalus appendiculatus]